MPGVQEFGGIGQAGLDVFLTDVRIVVQDLLLGPPGGKKIDNELDGEPCAFDDWFAGKDLGSTAMRSRQFNAIECQDTGGRIGEIAVPFAILRALAAPQWCTLL